MSQKDRYCYRGIIYPNREEFVNGIKYFQETPLNSASLELLSRELIDNLKGNLVDMHCLEERITNKKFRDILEEALVFIIEKANQHPKCPSDAI